MTHDESLADRAAKSIAEFCRAYGISRPTFNQWQKRGVGPALTQPIPDGRVLITAEAEAAWKARHTPRSPPPTPSNRGRPPLHSSPQDSQRLRISET